MPRFPLRRVVVACVIFSSTFVILFLGWRTPFNQNPETDDLDCKDEETVVSSGAVSPAFRRYSLIFQWPEQLGGNMRQFIYFNGVSRYLEARVVLPFVVHSRFVSFPQPNSRSLGEYFEIDAMNSTFIKHGYSPLATHTEFKQNCKRLDLLVVFMTDAPGLINRIKDNSSRVLKEVQEKLRENGGVVDGTFLREYLFSHEKNKIGMDVERILLFDENIPELDTYFRTLILQGNEHIKSIAFWKWMCKGDFEKGQLQIHLPKVIDRLLYPSDFPIHHSLTAAADRYIQKEFSGKEFIALNLRMEFLFRGARYEVGKDGDVKKSSRFKRLTECLNLMNSKINELKKESDTTLYVAIDMCAGGSDTVDLFIGKDVGIQACKNVSESLGAIKTFQTELIDEEIRKDRGKLSLVEADIVSKGKHLIIFGWGQYQRYFIIYPFLKRKNWNMQKVNFFCDLNGTFDYFTKEIEKFKNLK